MTTIREALQRGTQRLRGESEHTQGSERLDAQILLGHVLDEPRTTLYAYPERELSGEDEERFMTLIERRARREPVAYLIGQREFYGRDFYVDARVLIPRPETELLIETALAEIRPRLDAGQAPLVADIGAGSGIIPTTLALEEPRLPLLYACDISPEALEVASINCQHHGVEERVILRQGDLLQALPSPVDILVANLPYVGTDELPQIAPDVSEYEPHLALFSGPEGLGLLTRLCHQMSECAMLKPGGLCVLEIGYLQQVPLTNLLRTLWPQATITCIRDYAGWDRLLCMRLP